jgi:protein-tyrosine phosphatase
MAIPMSDATLATGLEGRHLPLGGTYNVRDLGGYLVPGDRVTRWRTLLRADALDQLDGDAHAVLGALGVRTVIDLRSDEEVQRAPDQLSGLSLSVLHRPLYAPRTPIATDPRRTLAEMYVSLIDERPQALVGAVRELAAPDALPAIVHCTAGKDRTGMVVALVLSAVGVDHDVIVEDFEMTRRFLEGAFREELTRASAERGISADRIEDMLSMDRALIVGFLRRIYETFGDAATFLTHYGMTDEELEQLRVGLLSERRDERDDLSRS